MYFLWFSCHGLVGVDGKLPFVEKLRELIGGTGTDATPIGLALAAKTALGRPLFLGEVCILKLL